jgi:hypothetical protein
MDATNKAQMRTARCMTMDLVEQNNWIEGYLKKGNLQQVLAC